MEYRSNRLQSIVIGVVMLIGAGYFSLRAINTAHNWNIALIFWFLVAIFSLYVGFFCLIYRVSVKINIQAGLAEEIITTLAGTKTKSYKLSDFKEVGIVDVSGTAAAVYGIMLLGKNKIIIPGTRAYAPGLFHDSYKRIKKHGKEIAASLNLPFTEPKGHADA